MKTLNSQGNIGKKPFLNTHTQVLIAFSYKIFYISISYAVFYIGFRNKTVGIFYNSVLFQKSNSNKNLTKTITYLNYIVGAQFAIKSLCEFEYIFYKDNSPHNLSKECGNEKIEFTYINYVFEFLRMGGYGPSSDHKP